jgi:hypothetical protein
VAGKTISALYVYLFEIINDENESVKQERRKSLDNYPIPDKHGCQVVGGKQVIFRNL